MPRIKSEKQYNSFIKGLITEASPLTFPANASLDEDNFVLNRDGSRERRLGIDYETGYAIKDTGLSAETVSGTECSFHQWKNPQGDTSVSIGVIRVYNRLWFYDLLQDPISSNALNGGTYIEISGLSNAPIDTAVINNFFVICSEDLEQPVLLEYDRDTQTVNQIEIPIMVRDQWGVLDGLEVNKRPSSLSIEHKWNLFNQGWNEKITTSCGTGGSPSETNTGGAFRSWGLVGTYGNFLPQFSFHSIVTAGNISALECTKTNLSVYPSNADIWSLGKVGDSSSPNYEKYDPATMKKNAIDNLEAPKGSAIIDAFRRGESRRNLIGDLSLPRDEELGNITTIASYAGRVFYSGVSSNVVSGDGKSPNFSNIIFFSQVVTDPHKLGKCYQEADPTSPNISDIVDTDGGFLHIPEATKIVKLVATRSSLLVFAENGIWELFGDTGGFTASSYQTSKISSVSCSSPKSIVSSYESVVAWTKAGIYVCSPDQVTGRYKAENISLTTIQTAYNDVKEIVKDNVRGFYDEKANVIRWLYNDLASYDGVSYRNRYNREIVFDLTLQAFYPQSIDTTLGPYIADYIDVPTYASSTFSENIYSDTDLVLVSADPVAVTTSGFAERTSQFSFLVMVGTGFTFGKYNNSSFIDWESYNTTGINYLSYLLTGYEIFGDILRHKQVPYIWFYFNRTEDGYLPMGYSNPSSCLVSSQWNWTDNASSGQWGTQFQAYKLLRNYTPANQSDPFTYGYEVIVTKHKLRGHGRALSLLIESESNKDLKLLGWALVVTGDANPDGGVV